MISVSAFIPFELVPSSVEEVPNWEVDVETVPEVVIFIVGSFVIFKYVSAWIPSAFEFIVMLPPFIEIKPVSVSVLVALIPSPAEVILILLFFNDT